MIENIRLAFQGIWGHKMRSVLTMLGIIIGIAAIITIVSTIQGTNEQIKENLIGAGNNVVTVNLNQSGYSYDMSWNSIPDGVRVITEETRQELKNISGVEEVSLYNSRNNSDFVYYQNTSFNGETYGIDMHYLSVYGYQVKSGRGFTQADYDNFRKVALVDANTVSTLFGGEDPVGKSLEVKGDVFTVVGVVALSKEFTPTIETLQDYLLYADTSSGCLYIPSTVWPTAFQFDEPQNVAIKVKNTDTMATAGKEAADLLTQKQIVDSEPQSGHAGTGTAAAKNVPVHQHPADLDRQHLPAGRRHRRYEHHAGVRDGADGGDRPEEGHRCEKEAHPAPVPDGVGGADQSGRHHRRHQRRDPRGADLQHDADPGVHQRAGHHRGGGVLHLHRRGVRYAPGLQGGKPEPHRGTAQRLKDNAAGFRIGNRRRNFCLC